MAFVKIRSRRFPNCRQFQNHYHNSAPTFTASGWAQLLILTPPSALVAVSHYLSSDTNPTLRENGMNELTTLTLYYHQIRDLNGLVNVLLFFFVVFRGFIARRLHP